MKKHSPILSKESVEGNSEPTHAPLENNSLNKRDPGHASGIAAADTSSEQPLTEARGGRGAKCKDGMRSRTSQGLGEDIEREDPETRTMREASHASVTDIVGNTARLGLTGKEQVGTTTVVGSTTAATLDTPVAPVAFRERLDGALQMEEGATEKIECGDASGTEDDLRKALVGFYGVHNPGKVSTIDVILAQYHGKEDLLIQRLEQKYSVDLSYARRTAGIQSSSTIPKLASPPPPTAATTASIPASTNVANISSARPDSLSPPRPTKVDPSAAVATANENQQNLRRGNGPTRVQISGQRLGAPTPQSNAAVSGAASSSYMTYLADQMRSKVENLLPSPGPSSVPGSLSSLPTSNYRAQHVVAGRGVGIAGDNGGSRLQRNAAIGPGHWGNQPVPSTAGSELSLNSSEFPAVDGVAAADHADDVAFARVKALEEERSGLLVACRRLQSKAEAAAREAAATEELREAGQRKMAGFAERAAAAERQTREAAVRIRSLESGQAALQTELQTSVRHCAAKHSQLLSAIDLQMALRSQLEGLLEVVPPSSWVRPKPGTGARDVRGPSEARGGTQSADFPGGTTKETPDGGGSFAISTSTPPLERRVESQDSGDLENRDVKNDKRMHAVSGIGCGDGGHGGDETEGGTLDELKRRCSLLEIALKASRREASEARRARDVAELTVSKQRAALVTLRTRVSDLEASFAKEQGSGKMAMEAARGLEAELGLTLDQLRDAEAKLSDQAEENARLGEELRSVEARLHMASVARAALVSFCRQERTAVELDAAEHVARAEESAAMRGEEGLAQGLELVRVAEEACEKRVAAATEEMDRLGKAVFAARAELAGSKAREQAVRRELTRAAETIAAFSQQESVAGGAPSGEVGVGETGKSARDSESLRDPVFTVESAGSNAGVRGSGRDRGRDPEVGSGGSVARSSLSSEDGGRKSGVTPSKMPVATKLQPAEVPTAGALAGMNVVKGVDERSSPDGHIGYDVEL